MTMRHKDGTRHPPVSRVPCPHPECARPKASAMTLDLDDLERKARWFRDECSAPITGPDPDDVLALIERVRATESERDEWRKRWEQEDENSRMAREDAQVARERVRDLERLWAEESSARIRKLDLSTKDR